VVTLLSRPPPRHSSPSLFPLQYFSYLPAYLFEIVPGREKKMVARLTQESSLPLHRHSYIGFILAFVSSIHNKQTENRCIGPRNVTSPVVKPERLMYLKVSDNDCDPAPFPSPPSLITHTHRCIGPHNATSPMTRPAREPAPSPSPRFSVTHAPRCIGPRNGTSPMTTPVRLMYLSVFDNST
jgi:hypothetical protein